MAKLERIWIAKAVDITGHQSIRIDWDNDRHQMVEIQGDTPQALIKAFTRAAMLLEEEKARGNI